jgi:hypothetical protein
VHPFQGAAPLGGHPPGIGQGVPHLVQYPVADLLGVPERQLTPHRGNERLPTQLTDLAQVAVAPRGDHRQARQPRGGFQGLGRALQRRRPRARQQVSHLLPTRGRLGDQPGPACPQVPQPGPLGVGLLRQVAVQPGDQLTDQHAVTVVGLVQCVVVAFPSPVHRQRLHTDEPHTGAVGQPHHGFPPVPGRLAAHRHPDEPVLDGVLSGPDEQGSQVVCLGPRDLAGQHHVVVIHQRRDLLVLTKIDRQDRPVTTDHFP